MSTTDERAYSLDDAAEIVGLSRDYLRKAVNRTDEEKHGPILKAKKVGNRTRIRGTDLWDWFERLPDA